MIFRVLAEWHVFATSHGKWLSDGIGGTIPNTLFEFIRSNMHGTNAKLLLSVTFAYRRMSLCLNFESGDNGWDSKIV